MKKNFSVAEARQNLPTILDQAEKGESAKITRRGKAIAVIVPIEQYQQMSRPSFWEALEKYRTDVEDLQESLDDVFDDVRDRSEGRKVEL